MKYSKCLLALILLSGCGPQTPSIPKNGPNNIDPAFQPLYDQFISQANQAGLNLNSNQSLSIQFTTLEQTNSLGEVIGECTGVGYGGGVIQIDRNYWNSADADTKLILLYHELGHCVLDEIHVTDQEAIMNALINYPVSYDSTGLPSMMARLFANRGDGG